MTIIQPNKNKNKERFLISILLMSSVVVAVWGVFLYNQLVNFRHEVQRQESDINQAEVMNAELKNTLYSTIDNKNLESVINSQSLILDKNPQYLKTEELVAAN